MTQHQDPRPEQDLLFEAMGLHRIVELDPAGKARLEYDAGLHMCHSGGVVQGGFVTGWIDAAMAHAAIARAGEQITPMTLEIKVSFLAPVRPGRVVAEAWPLRHGRKTCFYEGSLKDLDGNLLAKATSTMLLMDRGKVEAAARQAVEQPS